IVYRKPFDELNRLMLRGQTSVEMGGQLTRAINSDQLLLSPINMLAHIHDPTTICFASKVLKIYKTNKNIPPAKKPKRFRSADRNTTRRQRKYMHVMLDGTSRLSKALAQSSW